MIKINHKVFYFILFLFLPAFSFAQKEANIWYFGKNAGLDFNSNPPEVLLEGAMDSREGTATIADQQGRLLFYTNGETVWSKNHKLMENGTHLGGHASARQSSVIIPVPGKSKLYYIFTMDADESGYKNGLMYSVADLTANNGLGKITEKGVPLHAPGTESLSVAGSCTEGKDRDYWVVAGNNDFPDRVLAYKIDANGVNTEPVVSTFSTKAQISYIKFSPAGSKAVFIDQQLYKDPAQVIIADFDFLTGVFYNPNYLPVVKTDHFNQAEFSPNGKYLYVSSGSKILQIALTSGYPVIAETDTEPGFKGEFQLAPDGNIYMASHLSGLSVITYPNQPGLAGKYKEKGIDLKGRQVNFGLPNFERSLLYNGLNPNAGKDTLVCSGQALTLGMEPEEGAFYEWNPSDYLSSTNSAHPLFAYQNHSDTIRTFEYVLTLYNEVCAKKDTVIAQVHPAPPEEIVGSKSVCPGVVEVEYSVPEKEGYAYYWEVEGGFIFGGQGTPTLLVNWGPTNTDAKVRLISTSEAACMPVVLELPVRIHVALETAKPQGPTEVCANQRTGIGYATPKTRGSVYTWGISGGIITSGQGSHQVWVNWTGTGRHSLWVQEKSVTTDTVCYGTSDRLEVVVFKDSTVLELDYTSISLENEKYAEIMGKPDSGAAAAGNFVLYRRAWGTEAWTAVGASTKDSIYFTDGPLRSDEVSYEYRLSSRNSCGEEIFSLPHRTILLSGEAREEKEEVVLAWTPYTGWQKGVERYEVWKKVDEEENYRLAGATDGTTFGFTDAGAAAGFIHNFRIKALGNENQSASWSNEIELNFQHALSIPNVFTPNGDGVNETFHIEQLELYPDNELVIYNRWGQQIYSKKAYRGEWNGAGAPAGVYYYTLMLERTGRHLQGWVQLVRQEEASRYE